MISRKTDYALRCLIYLARQKEDEWVSASEMAKKLKISNVFLSKIFQVLIRSGVLEGRRGKAGGVKLKDKKITAGKVLTILEPDFCLNKCLTKDFHCFLEKQCPLHKILYKLNRELYAKLNSVSLASIANKEVR